MNREYEQPLNPPGWDAPDRKIKRQYIPMREYAMTLFNVGFWAGAEVEENERGDTTCAMIEGFCYDPRGEGYVADIVSVNPLFLSSRPTVAADTLQDMIEREICRQASELPGTAWEVEYEGDIDV